MLKDLFFRLRSVLRRGTVESEMEEELRFHSQHHGRELRLHPRRRRESNLVVPGQHDCYCDRASRNGDKQLQSHAASCH